MSISVSHKFHSLKADSPDLTLVNPSNWNDTHIVNDSSRNLWVDDYNFPAIPGVGSLAVGSNTITLNPIPKGILVGNRLYISGGAGAAEAVQITGWNPATGQAIVTCANSHSGGWTISSASDGIQETFQYANTLGGGMCYLSGSSYDVYATINCYSAVGLTGQGRFSSVIYKHGDFGSTFLAIQVNDLQFRALQIQQPIDYVPGTPGTATNLPTRGAHLDFRGVNGAYVEFIRLQYGFKNVSLTGGAEIYFVECQFSGMWDNRSGSPKATINQFALEADITTYGIPTFIKLFTCYFGGVNNETPQTPTNYSGVAANFGLVISSVEDFEMVGGFFGGANSCNVLILPSSGACLNIRFIGVRFDSAAQAEVQIATDGTDSHSCGDLIFSACQFNGEVAAVNAISIGGQLTTPLVTGLIIADCVFFAYGGDAMLLTGGRGIKISNNLIYYYNNFVNGGQSAIFIGGTCTYFDISGNMIGGGQAFQDYDGGGNKCVNGILAPNFGTLNKGTINNNTTPNGLASIQNKSDLVFLKGTLVSSTFAQLPPTPQQGSYATVSDSSTNTWGAVIAGGGANKVLAFYNGTAWTVAGK